jgi:hypothetical protein
MDSAKSEATRLLSASALLLVGSTFRKKILERVEEPYRASAPEIGLNLEFLTHMCKFAEQREMKYNLGFFALGIVPLTIFFLELGLLFFVKLPGLLTALIIVGPFILFFLLTWALQCYKDYEEKYRLLPSFVKDQYDPIAVAQRFNFKQMPGLNRDAEHGDKTGEDAQDNEQNLVIYSGFFPFVGAGVDLGGWSFVVDLGRPKEDRLGNQLKPIPFDIIELYAVFEQAICRLEIQGIVMKDYLFTHGVDIRHNKSILPDIFSRPNQYVPAETMKQYAGQSDFSVRHYKWIRIHDWKDELVFSYFLRIVRKSENLFVELSRFLLTPVHDRYRQVDSLKPKSWKTLLMLGLGTFFVAPFMPLYAGLTLLSKIPEFVNEKLDTQKRQRQGEIKSNPLFNYGVNKSIRELVSSGRYRHYFQKLDKEMYVKILDREILDTLIKFLDDHNIDTSQMQAERTTILNNGIIVQGGNVEAQSLAVGANAQAVLTQETTKPGPVTTPIKQEV